MMKIKRFAAIAIASVTMCMAPVSAYAAEDAAALAEQILESNQIDSLLSDSDKLVDIIVYVKDYIGNKEISDETVREAIDVACNSLGISLEDGEKDSLVNIFNSIKDMDLDEEQLRSYAKKAYDGLEALGIGKEEVKGFLHKAIDMVKDILS